MRPDPFPGKIGKTVAQSTRWWPVQPGAASSQPNVLVVLFDGVGFADPGCLGSTSRTPTIDALAARGLRLTGLHSTAMCPTTPAAPGGGNAAPTAGAGRAGAGPGRDGAPVTTPQRTAH